MGTWKMFPVVSSASSRNSKSSEVAESVICRLTQSEDIGGVVLGMGWIVYTENLRNPMNLKWT
jgi:hypothetical protein